MQRGPRKQLLRFSQICQKLARPSRVFEPFQVKEELAMRYDRFSKAGKKRSEWGVAQMDGHDRLVGDLDGIN